MLLRRCGSSSASPTSATRGLSRCCSHRVSVAATRTNAAARAPPRPPSAAASASAFAGRRRQQQQRRWFCDGSPDYRVEPLIPIPSAPVAAVAAALADGSASYIDCRSEEEYAAGVIPGSINLPYPHNGNREPIDAEEFLEDVFAEGFGQEEKIFVGCRKGPRSAMACEVLINAGFTHVVNVQGGIQAWVTQDLPIHPFTG